MTHFGKCALDFFIENVWNFQETGEFFIITFKDSPQPSKHKTKKFQFPDTLLTKVSNSFITRRLWLQDFDVGVFLPKLQNRENRKPFSDCSENQPENVHRPAENPNLAESFDEKDLEGNSGAGVKVQLVKSPLFQSSDCFLVEIMIARNSHQSFDGEKLSFSMQPWLKSFHPFNSDSQVFLGTGIEVNKVGQQNFPDRGTSTQCFVQCFPADIEPIFDAKHIPE